MSDLPTGNDAGSIPDSVPESRCGYTLDTADFSKEFPAACCWRPVWNETGRCIWHADIADKPVAELEAAHTNRPECLDGAILRGVEVTGFHSLLESRLIRADLTNASLSGDFTGSYLRGADLTDASLDWADLTDTDLYGADLTDAYLSSTDLTDANLSRADLTDAYLIRADFTDAVLTKAEAKWAEFERAILTRTDLFDTNLAGAKFYGATFDDTKINRGTTFGEPYIEALDEADGDDVDDDEATPWDRAAWSYRQLEELARRNALPEQAREAFENRKDVRRDELWHDDSWWSWVKWSHSKASSLVMRYGERPWRVVGTSLALIVGFGVMYPFAGGVYETTTTGDGTLHAIDWLPIPDLVGPLPDTVAHLLTSLYFSFVTFTTLGYGDIRPATGATQVLATIESFLGALLMALLVFVLGRRSTW